MPLGLRPHGLICDMATAGLGRSPVTDAITHSLPYHILWGTLELPPECTCDTNCCQS